MTAKGHQIGLPDGDYVTELDHWFVEKVKLAEKAPAELGVLFDYNGQTYARGTNGYVYRRIEGSECKPNTYGESTREAKGPLQS